MFHARFVQHTYPKHTHDDWTVFIVDDGAIRYELDRHERGVGSARITLLPPHVVHDGRAASDAGFRKRVLYVGADVLGTHLIGRAADEPDIDDPSLLSMMQRLHASLHHPDDALEAETLMGLVVEQLLRHLGEAAPDLPRGSDAEIAGALRDLLDTHLGEAYRLSAAAATIGASTSTLSRAFTRSFGIAPHRYVVGRRIEFARKRLLNREPVATVAATAGFHDQAHFTRHFGRHVGTTPARYATSGNLA
ncbi:MAG TPA: AraC family transcriptional regulator [Actinomycetota bacterium]|nr:AraC family transcriptional regulator [Actinomycetota bacterium]